MDVQRRKYTKKNMKDIINVFIHRRDLRIIDNTALNSLIISDSNTKVLHIFIFNPIQIDKDKNKYFSKNTVEFLVQSLQDLNHELNDSLHCFYGTDQEVLNNILKICQINTIAFNIDYTPFAIKRDKLLTDWCKSKNINCIAEEDYTLFKMNQIQTDKNDTYEVFTPFYNKCLTKIQFINEIRTEKSELYKNKKLPGLIKNIEKYYFNEPNYRLSLKGGRKYALDIIKKKILVGYFNNYDTYRNFPSMDKTTKLSAYIKYGCISIREVYNACKKAYGIKHGLIRELIWREFYANIAYNFPRVLQKQVGSHDNKAFKLKYDDIEWNYNKQHWLLFKQAKTGYPFVDAGIKQLLTTGWCHNRSRMVIAMFASKDLHIPPNELEKWFASNLIDYDPCSNSGGVQWAYGIGSDAQPYFRIFNPFLQSQKYDPECKYIKEWIPELRLLKNDIIHNWNEHYQQNMESKYPMPIVDHHIQSEKIKELFRV